MSTKIRFKTIDGLPYVKVDDLVEHLTAEVEDLSARIDSGTLQEPGTFACKGTQAAFEGLIRMLKESRYELLTQGVPR